MKLPTVTRSIRTRLFLQLAAISALLSVALFLVVRGLAETAAEATQDGILAASATSIADALRSEDGEITLDLPYSALSMLGTTNDDRVFYKVEVNDETLTGYDDLPPPSQSPTISENTFATFYYRGDEVRMVSASRTVSAGGVPSNVLISVAQTRLGLAAISQRITAIATGIGLVFFLVATALSLLAARSALRPLKEMTAAITRRGPADLRPLAIDPPTELEPFVSALNTFIARLRASLLRSEDLIAEAAHRVRTPLATVRAKAEVTHRKLQKPEHKQTMREMIRAIDESSRSAGQLLDHAMVTFRTDSLSTETFDMAELVRETAERLEPAADLKDVTIRCTTPDTTPAFTGDRILLQSAIQNILDNAIKYSPDDSAIDVDLSVAETMCLSFTDRGRGFGEADTDSLKTRFSRGANVDDIVGSGLGLTIADEVARAHGGQLNITRNEGSQGACVSLIFPRQ
ncbi:sensor histidine kinase [uncultured Boseongicola sp.]|uniref:sensor histidine kinase n=1 Tax=uncultured Boseongicola sp. TaxID=1648499 RepID=UPI0026393273|nr:sensor histidine kinase [uncultured Boseongicola sp.]